MKRVNDTLHQTWHDRAKFLFGRSGTAVIGKKNLQECLYLDGATDFQGLVLELLEENYKEALDLIKEDIDYRTSERCKAIAETLKDLMRIIKQLESP
jgi:hypothetical protein